MTESAYVTLRWFQRLLVGTALSVPFGSAASAYLAYVSNEKANTVTVIDTDTFEAVKTIKVGQRPRGIEVTKDGQFVLVACGDDDIIQMIDTKTDEITGTLPSGPDPELFSQDPTGELLYVAN
jgi:YVTN family beta-propeller protein